MKYPTDQALNLRTTSKGTGGKVKTKLAMGSQRRTALATTGGNFAAARSRVRIIDFSRIPDRFNQLGRLGTGSLPCWLPRLWRKHIPTGRTGNSHVRQGRLDIHHMGRGVQGTASPPSLEQTMGGLDKTQAWLPVPRTTAWGGGSLLSHILRSGSPRDPKIPHKQ